MSDKLRDGNGMKQIETGQIPLEAVPDGRWDAVVAGAGPAGSTAAMRLAGRGFKVLLMDREMFPREKVCGDGLTLESFGPLMRSGLYEDVIEAGHRVGSAIVYSPSGIRHELGLGMLTLRRGVLDAILAAGACRAGACFCLAEADAVAAGPGGDAEVRLRGGVGRVFSARVVVLATGANIGILKRQGMLQRGGPSAAGLRAYVRSPHPLRHAVVSFDRQFAPGYAWIFPLGGGLFNVGCGTTYTRKRKGANLSAWLSRFLSSSAEARGLMEAGGLLSTPRGWPLRCGLDQAPSMAEARVLAVGEAIGTTHPLSGEGVGAAMRCGELAAEAIEEALMKGDMAALEGFGARVRNEMMPRHRAYRTAERWLSMPWVTDLIAWKAPGSGFLRKALVGIVAGTVRPDKVFSIRGIIKSVSS